MPEVLENFWEDFSNGELMATVSEIQGILKLVGGAGFESELKRRLDSARRSFLNVGNVIAGAGIGFFFNNLNRAANQAQNAALALRSVAQFKGIQGADQAVKQLEAVRLGLIQDFEAAEALKNLLARGYNLDQALSTLDRLSNAAAFNRVSHLSLAEAVKTATEGLKNENSILVDNAGVTKNISVIHKEYADSIGKTVAQLTLQEKIQAEVVGIGRETAAQMGDLAKLSNTAAGAQARFTAQLTLLRAQFGQILQQFAAPLISFFSSVLKFLTDGTPALRNFVAASGGVLIFFKLLGPAISALLPALGPVGWLALGLSVLTSLFFAFQSGAKESTTEVNAFNEALQRLTLTQAETKLQQLKDAAAALQTEIGLKKFRGGFFADTEQQQRELNRIKEQISELEKFIERKRAERLEADKGAAEDTFDLQLKIKEFEFETGKITTEHYLQFLRQRLGGLKQYEDDWFRISKRIYDLEKDLQEKSLKETEQWKKMRQSILEQAGTDSENLWNRLLRAQDDFEEAQDERNRSLQDKWRTISDFIAASVENLFGGIFGAVQRGENMLKAILKSILITTLEFIKQFFVLAKIKALLEGIINPLNILKNLAPLAIALGLITAAQGAIASFGEGAIVRKPTLAMVGERGEAEAVIPLSKIGQVMDSLALAGRGNGGSGGTFVANFNSPLQDRRLARQYMEKVIKPGVRRELKRSGRVTNRKIF